MHTLKWIPLDPNVQTPLDITFQEADGRVYFTYPEGLSFGHLELDGVQVTGYMLPEADGMIHTLRPWMLTNDAGNRNKDLPNE